MARQVGWIFVIAALSGCPAPATPTARVDATAEVAVAADAIIAADGQGKPDAAEAAGADAGTPVAFADYICGNLAASACQDLPASCCDGPAPATCATKLTSACLKLGYDGVDGDVVGPGWAPQGIVQDMALAKAADAALDKAVAACDRQAILRAMTAEIQAFADTNALGQPCHYAAPLSCAGGQGRCDPKTSDAYVCAPVGKLGDSCKLSQPCPPSLTCANTALTRAMVCSEPGTTCQLSDSCWDGFVCSDGKCKPENKPVPAACSADSDCPGTMACSGGKCRYKVCGG